MTDDAELTLDFSLIRSADRLEFLEESRLGLLAHHVLTEEGAMGAWEIAVALLSDQELQALHLQFMGIDEPTDIMTFPYGDENLGGDLAISYDHDRAAAQALKNNRPDWEIGLRTGYMTESASGK